MSTITDRQITQYVETHIGTFHEKRLEALSNLDLSELLVKNPYLLRSKNLVVAGDLVKAVLDAYLSSQEETLFGDFLEGLVVYVAGQVHGGLKSGITGIDLEFVKNGVRYIVSIKSGPNWGNSSQVKDMRTDFRTATRVIRQRNPSTVIVAVNGCCYGRDHRPDKGDYFKYCGQDFWELISEDRDLFTRLIQPLGYNAKERNDEFNERYGTVVNRCTREFIQQFCDTGGAIDWDKLVRYNSASTPFLSFPADKRSINRLPAVINVWDLLHQWGYHDLADTVADLDTDGGMANHNSWLDLPSLKGFVMLLGTVQSDATINLTATPDGLIIAEWQFTDLRHAVITFHDIDRVTIEAMASDGQPVRIRRSMTGFNQRRTIARRLVEERLFTIRQAK